MVRSVLGLALVTSPDMQVGLGGRGELGPDDQLDPCDLFYFYA